MAEQARPASPSQEEREKLDAAAKAKELEEQSKLPYKWTQTIGELDLTAVIPANIKGKDLDVKLTRNGIKAAIKGQEPIIEVFTSSYSHYPSCADIRTGRLPPPDPRRRFNLDARIRILEQRAQHPPRQSQQDGMVGSRRHLGPQDRHLQNFAREQQSERSGR